MRIATCYFLLSNCEALNEFYLPSQAGPWEFYSPSIVIIIMHLSTFAYHLHQFTKPQFFHKHLNTVPHFSCTEMLPFVIIIMKTLKVSMWFARIVGTVNWVVSTKNTLIL
jgi:hypothetical protein